ncbi:MAG: hypothetical protein WKF32_04045 [Thermoleophilaceae bacterium]
MNFWQRFAADDAGASALVTPDEASALLAEPSGIATTSTSNTRRNLM